jgi:hypothetical protein
MVLGALAGLLVTALLWSPRTRGVALPFGGATGLGLIVTLSLKIDDDRWERSPEGQEARDRWTAEWREAIRLAQIETDRYKPIDFQVPRGGIRIDGRMLDSLE